MVFLHIDKSNYNKAGVNLANDLDKLLGGKTNKVFILFFMEGCGPCNATRPEWNKLENVLAKDFLNRKDIVIASIDHNLTDDMKNVKQKPSSFPTIRYISNSGNTAVDFEDSNIQNKERTLEAFIDWIKLTTGEKNITKSERPKNKTGIKRHTYSAGKTRRRRQIGGKWSQKYKKSINCRRPKGFSQRQHCKYGRK
jgi:thiol-disulfide isomerase/thioredoxin